MTLRQTLVWTFVLALLFAALTGCHHTTAHSGPVHVQDRSWVLEHGLNAGRDAYRPHHHYWHRP